MSARPQHDPPASAPDASSPAARPSLAALSDLLDRRRGARLLALLALVLVAFAFQGVRPLFDPDEGRYTSTAINMLEGGDWLIPHLHRDVPHVTKPPLTTWLLASALAMAGRTEWAVRLPGALGFLVSVLCVLGMARRLVPGRAWLAAVVQATMLMPLVAANVVTPDPVLAAWEALAAYGFVVGWWAAEAGPRRAGLLLGWSAFGLAFLTKGPPGLLPLAGFLLFAAWRQGLAGLRRVAWPPAVLGFVVVATSWYVVACLHLPWLLRYFLEEEVLGRVAGTHSRNAAWYGALVIYVPTLLVGTLPWTGALLRPLGRPRALLRRLRGLLTRDGDERAAFLAAWLVVPLFVFFLARSRLPLYLLPLGPALSLVVARALPEGRLRSRTVALLLPLWVLLALTPRWFPGVVPDHQDARALAAAVREVAPGHLDEVVFVDTSPRHGLAFYLDVAVEHVELGLAPGDEGGSWRPPDLLTDGVALDEGRRLFVFRTSRLERDLPLLEEAGLAVPVAGRFRDLTLSRLSYSAHASTH